MRKHAPYRLQMILENQSKNKVRSSQRKLGLNMLLRLLTEHRMGLNSLSDARGGVGGSHSSIDPAFVAWDVCMHLDA